jgi:uncharacterized protein (TIGR02147 family)
LDAVEYAYFEKWYYIAIRELLGFYKFKGDFGVLARLLEPPILPKEAKKAIEQLTTLGLIRKGPDGYLEPTDQHISTGEEWSCLAIANYQVSALTLALEAMNRFPRDIVDFSTMTLRMSKKHLALVREKVKALRKDLASLESSPVEASSVYQVNINLFPLTKTNIGEKKS